MANELKCDFCKKVSHDVVHYHQRTQFVEEKRNWVNACPECKRMNDEYLDELWAELYGDIGRGVGA